MPWTARPPGGRHFPHRPLPGNPASAVYGTILVAAQLAVESATGESAGQMIATLASTLVVFWLAHSYADTLGTTINASEHEPPSLRAALRIQWPIVESGILPGLTLALVEAAGAAPTTGAVAGLVVAALELVGWGALAARRGGQTGWRLVASAALAAAVGGVLVALKYLIH
jgi:hypothetical protein